MEDEQDREIVEDKKKELARQYTNFRREASE